jgi:hypothetical protein
VGATQSSLPRQLKISIIFSVSHRLPTIVGSTLEKFWTQ